MCARSEARIVIPRRPARRRLPRSPSAGGRRVRSTRGRLAVSSNRRRTARSPVVAAILAGAMAVLFGGPAAGIPVAVGARAPVAHRNVRHNPFGHFLGVVPTTTGGHRATAASNGTPPLTYHGGPVQHSSTAYAIFWSPK